MSTFIKFAYYTSWKLGNLKHKVIIFSATLLKHLWFDPIFTMPLAKLQVTLTKNVRTHQPISYLQSLVWPNWIAFPVTQFVLSSVRKNHGLKFAKFWVSDQQSNDHFYFMNLINKCFSFFTRMVSTLIIKDVSVSDAGYYRCTVTQGNKVVESGVLLTIQTSKLFTRLISK